MVELTQADFFDFVTPDPKFSGFTVEEEGQLPGRPMEGRLEIATLFDHLLLLVTEAQQRGSSVNGEMIFDHLKETEALVLGPNLGQLLYENQHLIPSELRGRIVLTFWGKIYRDLNRRRYVRCLFWDGGQWVWACQWVDSDHWVALSRVVVLAQKP